MSRRLEYLDDEENDDLEKFERIPRKPKDFTKVDQHKKDDGKQRKRDNDRNKEKHTS